MRLLLFMNSDALFEPTDKVKLDSQGRSTWLRPLQSCPAREPDHPAGAG